MITLREFSAAITQKLSHLSKDKGFRKIIQMLYTDFPEASSVMLPIIT